MYFAYPHNVVKIMRPQIDRLKGTIRHHYSLRHENEQRKRAVHNWIRELRRVDQNSGYSIAMQQITK